MKVSELIELLKDMPQDLEVYSYTDHGQTPEKTSTPSVAYTTEISYSLWEDWTTEEEALENEYKRSLYCFK